MTHESFSPLLLHFKLHLRFVLVVSFHPFGTCFLMLTKKLCFPFIWLQFPWECMFIDKIDCFFHSDSIPCWSIPSNCVSVWLFQPACFSAYIWWHNYFSNSYLNSWLIVYEMPYICNYTICWLYRLGHSFILII